MAEKPTRFHKIREVVWGQILRQRFTRPNDSGPILHQVRATVQELQGQLDEVIRTRLPQFRDVIESPDKPSSTESGEVTEKRKTAERIIDNHASWAAANAFNPVPGLDIGLDLKILTSLSRSLAVAYGLNEEQQAALINGSTAHLLSYPAVHQVIERMAPRVLQGALATTLRRVGLELLARETAKWVPLTGSLGRSRDWLPDGVPLRAEHSTRM